MHKACLKAKSILTPLLFSLHTPKIHHNSLNLPIFLQSSLSHHLRKSPILRRKSPPIGNNASINQHFQPPRFSTSDVQNPNPFYSFQSGENTPQFTSSNNVNSTSDEAEEYQKGIVNERKQRKKVSNRESARRMYEEAETARLALVTSNVA
ncbi:unnamed protein product [Microthlaspi erraticum]|uniref:BZIP domain-containing protein n=1 Tax=Microthlaspi erraticum TaxID=1685480 RepID=A0A6D2KQ53_9BRAS|nr:unnamed protein product [Microthlaspi erraticum]